MRVRTAIYGTYAGASAVGFAVLMVFVLTEVRTRYIQSIQRDLQGTAETLAAVAANEDLGAFAARLERREPARADAPYSVLVLDATGAVPLRPPAEALPSPLATVAAQAPVGDPGHPRGWIRVRRSLGSVEGLIATEQRRLASVAAVIALVFALAGWVLAARLTRSLEGLAAYVRAAKPGTRRPPPTSRAAEIADLARAFEEMRAQAEGRAYIEQYTQTLTHELKAPLAAIQGAAEILAEHPPQEDQERFIANIRSESDRVRALIDRLLDLAALEAHCFETTRTPVDLAALVQEALRGAQGAAAARGVTFRAEDRGPAWVSGDAFLLRQALTNLIQNAVEFSPAGGAVTLTLAERDRAVVLEVLDEGAGIPAYAVPRMFERFYSLPRPSTGRKGTGLGLSIVREVALLHGGAAAIENRAGGGACARLTLPAAAG